MDRYLAEYSWDASGNLTRSLDDASTSGFIRDDAPHWSIEPFVPLHAQALTEFLVARKELSEEEEARFGEACSRVDNILQNRTAAYQREFATAYRSLDPDADTREPDADTREPDADTREPSHPVGEIADPVAVPDPATADSIPALKGLAEGERSSRSTPAECQRAQRVVSLCEEVLDLAGYRKIGQQDIEQCVGVASQWGVPLHVDLNLFEQLVVYARGDIIGTRLRRRLRKLYRREAVTVPIYQRMFVVFRLRDDVGSEEKLAASAVHLRIFKNIPKQDIDMLLPGSRVRISGVDRAKIVLPSLGGFLMSVRKLAQYAILFAAFFTLHWLAILVVIVAGYLIKSVLSYFQTKNRYQLNLTRNLYFQKLDANAGAAFRLFQQAHEQSSAELILALYGIVSGAEPISGRRLRRRCERLIREAIDVEVDFQVDRVLELLLQSGLICRQGDKWTVAGERHSSVAGERD